MRLERCLKKVKMSKLVLTFAGDESGDSSFKFGKGASKTFVIAVIATEDPERLRDCLAEIGKIRKLHPYYEFKFHKITSKNLKKAVFEKLAREDYKTWAIVVDKTVLPDTFKFMTGLDFYLYFVTEVINHIPAEEQAGALLILDQFGDKGSISINARRALKSRNIQSHFSRIVARDSATEPLIQIADLMAGVISHRDSSNGNEYYDLVSRKIVEVIEYTG